MPEIRIALAGVGNCTSSLIQGIYYYKNVKKSDNFVPGLMHPVIGGYGVSDIRPVVAFDIDIRKVGKDLSEAIWAGSNCTVKFCDVPQIGAKVQMGPVKDGAPDFLRKYVKTSNVQPVEDVAKVLKEEKVDVLINNLPTGSSEAAWFYAEKAIEAGCGFVNGIPELIVNNEDFARRAQEAGSSLVGDDYKSQLGGTIQHRALINLFLQRGIKIVKSSQLNYGGNTDFWNLIHRGEAKHKSKLRGIESVMPYEAEFSVNVSHLSLLNDTKVCRIEMWGENFGGTPIKLETKLEVIDSPNSAGVMVDAIRCCKLAKDRKIGGVLTSVCAYLMKSAPRQFPDEEARRMLDEFIEGKRER